MPCWPTWRAAPRMSARPCAPVPSRPRCATSCWRSTRRATNELHRAALAANALSRLYAEAVAHCCDAERRCGLRDPRHRRAWPDRAPPAGRVRRPRLHAAAPQPGAAGRTRAASTWWPTSAAATSPPAARARRWCRPSIVRCSPDPGETVAVLNLGGIANLTVLGADGTTLGFDCGPANALMDHWCQLHTGRLYDDAGAWAGSGSVLAAAAGVDAGRALLRAAAAQEHRARPVQPALAGRAAGAATRPRAPRTCRPRWPS